MEFVNNFGEELFFGVSDSLRHGFREACCRVESWHWFPVHVSSSLNYTGVIYPLTLV